MSRESIEATLSFATDEMTSTATSDAYDTAVSDMSDDESSEGPFEEQIQEDLQWHYAVPSTPTPAQQHVKEVMATGSAAAAPAMSEWSESPSEALRKENEYLRDQIEMLKNADTQKLLEENERLRKELNDVKMYMDRTDIEQEQQYTELTTQLDEMCDCLEQRSIALSNARAAIASSASQIESLNKANDSLRSQVQRQLNIIEDMREELDNARVHVDSAAKDKARAVSDADGLRNRLMKEQDANTALQLQLDEVKSEAQKEALLLAIDVDDLRRQLDIQKELLDARGLGHFIDKWEQRCSTLENQIRERDLLINTQQLRLNDLRKVRNHSTSPSMSDDSLSSSGKMTVIRFLVSSPSEQLRQLRSLSSTLDLSPEEEDALKGRAHDHLSLIRRSTFIK